jgi:hypothetical protein
MKSAEALRCRDCFPVFRLAEPVNPVVPAQQVPAHSLRQGQLKVM